MGNFVLDPIMMRPPCLTPDVDSRRGVPSVCSFCPFSCPSTSSLHLTIDSRPDEEPMTAAVPSRLRSANMSEPARWRTFAVWNDSPVVLSTQCTWPSSPATSRKVGVMTSTPMPTPLSKSSAMSLRCSMMATRCAFVPGAAASASMGLHISTWAWLVPSQSWPSGSHTCEVTMRWRSLWRSMPMVLRPYRSTSTPKKLCLSSDFSMMYTRQAWGPVRQTARVLPPKKETLPPVSSSVTCVWMTTFPPLSKSHTVSVKSGASPTARRYCPHRENARAVYLSSAPPE
mmetsp:Transcript_20434/g.34238  ORF Transcript_20434/g.34238 Transcript_20434/m.34238 type:complete len:285 (-) Transcript_20434:465-1319(-)